MKRLARTLWDDPMLVIAPVLTVGAITFLFLAEALGLSH